MGFIEQNATYWRATKEFPIPNIKFFRMGVHRTMIKPLSCTRNQNMLSNVLLGQFSLGKSDEIGRLKKRFEYVLMYIQMSLCLFMSVQLTKNHHWLG